MTDNPFSNESKPKSPTNVTEAPPVQWQPVDELLAAPIFQGSNALRYRYRMPPGRSFGFWSTCGIVFTGFLISVPFSLVPATIWFASRGHTFKQVANGFYTNGMLFGLSSILMIVSWALFVSVFAVGRGTWRHPQRELVREGSLRQYLAFIPVSFLTILFWAILFPLAFLVASHFIETHWIKETSRAAAFLRGLLHDRSSVPYVLLAVLVAAPLGEEIIFRGFLYRGIENSPLGTVGAILLTSFCFTALHVQYGPEELAILLVLAVSLGIARAYTDSIIPGILLHFSSNLGAILLYYSI